MLNAAVTQGQVVAELIKADMLAGGRRGSVVRLLCTFGFLVVVLSLVIPRVLKMTATNN